MDLTISPTARFWRLLKPDQAEVRNVYIYALFNGLVYLSLPLGIQAIINLIQGGQVNSSWILLVTLVVAGVVFSGILQISQMRITENLQQKIFARAAFEFAYRVPRIKMEALYRRHAPELMNRFFDIVSVQKGLSKILIDFSIAVLNIVFGLILLSFYHSFFVLFGVALVLLVIVLFRFTAKKGLDTSIEESKHKYAVASWLEEIARTRSTFKLAGHTDLPLKRTNEHVECYLESRENHFQVIVRQFSLLIVFKALVATGLLAVGGFLVMQQQMNIGQFVAAEIIILMVINSVEKLNNSLETIYDVLTALEKVGQVTDLELERRGMQTVENEEVEDGIVVELEKLSFKYPDNERNVLDRLDLNLQIGDKIVVTGPNGSGKSTFLQVLAGLYKPKEGRLLFNEVSIDNLERESLRTVMGDFLAHEDLFEGTVLENIVVGRDGISRKDVDWALKSLKLNEFVLDLPSRLDTKVDPLGKTFPRSITHKLLLARSIVHRPKILLLEDALEHVEEADQKHIIEFLTSKENNWTLIAVSSNPQFAAHADRVMELRGGQLTELKKGKSSKR